MPKQNEVYMPFYYLTLEGTACYAGFFLAATEAFGQGFFGVYAYFWCSVVTSVIFSSSHSNLKKRKEEKNLKNQKNLKETKSQIFHFLIP